MHVSVDPNDPSAAAVGTPACIDPNAEMLRKDAIGDLQQTRRDWERTCKVIHDLAYRHDRSEPDPGANLGIVAPMDHRLGRFNC